ncbi:hypothetical protein SERLADRAFT_459727 [Serpula lacrymans var. lacrymans S7.9]|uniref:Uncharacterized protein n=1 Tax=Serpula lacrymans var. lacrymans (strain S7.9) TaxID=578457 RepID=F8NL55_SERL9|nr:uncharacterized protein SERLADRAFT_459727 [Serpula lacrymans var. lacrymans S7.9]EGO28871.1 hypothetical protein SERLADRAFT_459727 [Serpula lacrymans var. lacrymans S7.9]
MTVRYLENSFIAILICEFTKPYKLTSKHGITMSLVSQCITHTSPLRIGTGGELKSLFYSSSESLNLCERSPYEPRATSSGRHLRWYATMHFEWSTYIAVVGQEIDCVLPNVLLHWWTLDVCIGNVVQLL